MIWLFSWPFRSHYHLCIVSLWRQLIGLCSAFPQFFSFRWSKPNAVMLDVVLRLLFLMFDVLSRWHLSVPLASHGQIARLRQWSMHRGFAWLLVFCPFSVVRLRLLNLSESKYLQILYPVACLMLDSQVLMLMSTLALFRSSQVLAKQTLWSPQGATKLPELWLLTNRDANRLHWCVSACVLRPVQQPSDHLPLQALFACRSVEIRRSSWQQLVKHQEWSEKLILLLIITCHPHFI